MYRKKSVLVLNFSVVALKETNEYEMPLNEAKKFTKIFFRERARQCLVRVWHFHYLLICILINIVIWNFDTLESRRT